MTCILLREDRITLVLRLRTESPQANVPTLRNGSWSHLLGQWKKIQQECSPYETAKNKEIIHGQGIIHVTAWNRYVGLILNSFIGRCLAPQDIAAANWSPLRVNREISTWNILNFLKIPIISTIWILQKKWKI